MNYSRKETDLIVSILNLNFERLGYNMEDSGSFGYDSNTLQIGCNDCSLEEGLECLWKELIKQYGT